MAYVPKILAFAGSTRKESFNKRLVKVAAEAARSMGAEVTYVDLRDIPMPLYDGDLEAEQGLPENAKKFKAMLMAHDGFLLSAPEYNSSITGVLKNTIDWASRPATPDEAAFAGFAGKVVALMSASPGALGGLRSLVTVRSLLSNMRVIVLPEQVAVPKAHEAFGPDGKLKDAKQQVSIEGLARNLVTTVTKLKG
jgi:NAD(P)H-dependent FMN reductase